MAGTERVECVSFGRPFMTGKMTSQSNNTRVQEVSIYERQYIKTAYRQIVHWAHRAHNPSYKLQWLIYRNSQAERNMAILRGSVHRMLNVVSSGGMPKWQEVYLPEGIGNGHRAASQMLVLLMGQYGALPLMAVPKRNNEHNEQTDFWQGCGIDGDGCFRWFNE